MDKGTAIKWLVGGGASIAVALSGVGLIKPHEGEVKDRNGMHVAYLDAVGIPTICYGQTGKDLYGRKIELGMKLKQEECMEMLVKTLNKFEKEVDALVKVEYKSPYQKAALISFAYNVGTTNLARSSLLKTLNAGNHTEACNKLSDWVYAQKKKLNGLVRRREEEKAWCLGDVPMDIKVTYSEIVDLVKQTAEKR
jgi:lysozyme